MANGMYVKDIFVKNVFKNNLENSLEEEKENMQFIEKQIIAYITSSPELLKFEFEERGLTGIISEVENLLKEYQNSAWKYNLIQHAIDFPEDASFDNDI